MPGDGVHADDFQRDVVPRFEQIEGWLTHDQALRLYAAAQGCPSGGRIVEIGSFQGRSTVLLALGAPQGVEVVAIDPHAGNDRGPNEIEGFADAAQGDHEAFEKNLAAAGVRERVRHVRRFSDAAHGEVEGPIDVLFIDGAHRYRPARRDIEEWGARVTPGGTMLIHDSFSSVGVTAAIARGLFWSRSMRYVGRSRSLAIYRRSANGSLRGRLTNAGGQVAQLPWFLRNVGLKLALTLGIGKLLSRFGRAVPEWPY